MKYTLTEEEIFAHRPIPFFFITTTDMKEFTEDKIREKLMGLRERGFGGIVFFNKPPIGFDAEHYLGEEWFTVVRSFCKVCSALGLPMWINDGFDFPPGAAGGRVKELCPELEQQYLEIEDGKITVKKADWGFPAFEDPRSGQLFRKLVYEAYREHIGEYFGNTVIGFFSDADNRRVLPPAMFASSGPQTDYFPWSDTFAETFEKEYGYDIVPYLSQILAREDICQAEDYWEHSGHLFQQWFAGNGEWLRAHGLEYTSHSTDTPPFRHDETPRTSALTEGRFLDLQRHFTYPGTDQELLALDGGKHVRASSMYVPHVIWGDHIHMDRMEGYEDVTTDTRARQAASTAFIYDKKGAMCEMFAASNFGVSSEELMQIAAFQMMEGITFVVPHAYHYRFCGEIKYFAPPEFSEHGMLDSSVREINQSIAETAAMLGKGEAVYPIVLLDPTSYIWRNTLDSKEYFKAFSQLNRMPWGFAICDIKRVLEKNHGFKIAVSAGFELSDEEKQALERKGIVLLTCRELVGPDGNMRVAAILNDCDIRYEGTGVPHFTRRIIDGEEFVFIANIESTETISGKLTAYGRTKTLRLAPGEIRYMSKTYDDIPEIKATEYVMDLPEEAEARFDTVNVIPLERFCSPRGIVTKCEGDKKLWFDFTSKDRLKGLTLTFPVTANGKAALDGTELIGHSCYVADDECVCFELPDIPAGDHSLCIETENRFFPYDRILLQGDFDVEAETDHTEYKEVQTIYNIGIYIPYEAKVTLSTRSSRLSINRSWAEQGQPFYSGKAVYSWDIVLPEKAKYLLDFPRVRDAATLSVDFKEYGKCIRRPYEFMFEAEPGKHHIELSVVNSYGNAMECYREESGILGGAKLHKLI